MKPLHIHYVLEFIICLLDVILMYRFGLLFLERKKKEAASNLFYIALFSSIILFITVDAVTSLPGNALILVISIAFVSSVFKGDRALVFFVAILFIIGLGLLTVLVLVQASFLLKVEPQQFRGAWRIQFNFFVKVLFFAIIELIHHVRPRKKLHPFMSSQAVLWFLVLSFVTMTLLFDAFFSTVSADFYLMVPVMIVVFIIFFSLLFMVMSRLAKNKRQLVEVEVLLAEVSSQQARNLEHDLYVLRAKHDLGNHLIALKYLIQQADLGRATQFIESMQTLPLYQSKVQTPNEIVNAIISAKIATHPKIHFDVWADIQDFPFRPLDLATLLGNALDNAIEAVSSLHKPTIDVTLSENAQYGKIVISNPYQGEVQIIHNKVYSAKRKKAEGIGLLSMAKTIESMQGRFILQTKDQVFTVTMIMKKPVSQ